MNILHLVISLDMGGLETMVCSLAQRQQAHGHKIYLGYIEHPGELSHRIQPIASWTGALATRSRIRTAASLIRFIRKHHIDIIHSHDPQPHFYAVLAHIFTHTPIIHTKHGRNYPDMPRRVLLNRILSWFTEQIVAVSDDVAKLACTLEHTNPAKVVVIRNGIDVTDYRPQTTDCRLKTEDRGQTEVTTKARRHEGEERRENSHREHKETQRGDREGDDSSLQSPLTIGTVGRLSSEKNYGLLLEAFALLLKDRLTSNASGLQSAVCSLQSDSPSLLLVGDGPDRTALETLAKNLGIHDYVEFTGTQHDPLPFYQKMDVFCLTSDTEGTPITLLEAGACGLPSVVTNVGGNAEVIQHGKTGLVVPARDIHALIKALSELLTAPGLRHQMGQAARERITQHYSITTMTQQYDQLYNKCIQTQRH